MYVPYYYTTGTTSKYMLQLLTVSSVQQQYLHITHRNFRLLIQVHQLKSKKVSDIFEFIRMDWCSFTPRLAQPRPQQQQQQQQQL